MSLSKRDDLDAIRERSRVWSERHSREHNVSCAGRASRDRQILLRTIDAILGDRRLTCPIEIDALVDEVAKRVHADAAKAQRTTRESIDVDNSTKGQAP